MNDDKKLPWLFILAFLLGHIFILSSFSKQSFKNRQKKYPRVRQAYKEKEVLIKELLKSHSISIENLNIYLRVFKLEKKLELWAKNVSDEIYKHVKTYDICQTSGVLGPKRCEGDLQIPEGYYYIDRFNPCSEFYLSLGINYPNKSDKILGVKGRLGGDIFIHGACVTIGCIPITDDKIKELYILCIEARQNKQSKILVTIFPARFTDETYDTLKNQNKSAPDQIRLWTDLRAGYQYFNDTKVLPNIKFLRNGRHELKQ